MAARRGAHPALAGGPLGFAHRGFTPLNVQVVDAGRWTHAWENTAEAFAAALQTGLRHLETDVHATSDGVCVVLHDPDLGRTTDRTGLVSRLPWREVAKARVAGRFAVPRLDDVLASFGEAMFCVDCKVDSAAAPMAAAIRSTGAADRVIVAAFDGSRSALVARAAPGVARAAGLTVTAGVRLAAGLGGLAPAAAVRATAVVARGIDVLAIPLRRGRLQVLTPALLAAAHGAGKAVVVWTVDDARQMRRLFAEGVDGVMSDRGDLLAQVLRER